jgi:hypothetical protein
MAIPILNHMDFNKSAEIRNVRLHNQASSGVSSPGTGQILYDSGSVKIYNGSAWLTLASGGGTRAVSLDTNGDGSVNNTLELSETLVLKKGSGVSLAEVGGVVTISATGSQLTGAQVKDFAGAMFTSNTETGITATYQAADDTVDLVIGAGDIVHSMLADDSVDPDNIAADAVVTAGILDANVTMAKLANIATDTFIGRTADNAGVPKALSKAEALAILNVADGAQVNVSGDSGNAAIYDNSGTPAFKSGITKAEVQTLLNIEDGATADQTAAQVRTLVGTGNAGVIPTTGTDGHFLKHDGTFGIPAYVANTDVDVSNANLLTRLAALESASSTGDENIVIGTDSGDTIVITGNLQVSGTTTTVNSTTVNLNDHNITLDSGNSTSAVVNGAGITLEGGSGSDATITYSTTGPKFEFKLGAAYEDVAFATVTNGLWQGTAIASAYIAADAITGAKIADDAVDSEHIAADSIDAEHYAAGSVDATALASNAVTTVKINADAVTSAKIADDAIDSEHITDGSVDNAHLAGSITNAKLSNSSITIDGSAISLGGSVTTNNTQLAFASAAEVQAGTNTAKAVNPDKLAAKSVHATIDVSDSNFTSNLYAEINHGLGSEDLIVQLFDSSSKETVFADIARTDKDNSASTAKIKVTFASAPAADIEVVITSIQGSSAGTVAYA